MRTTDLRRIISNALMVMIGLTALAACGTSNGNSSSDSTDTTTSYSTTWQKVVAPPDCMCGDGSEYAYFVREADPTKVLFYLEGGGACFTGPMCGPSSTSYKKVVGDGAASMGIFDLANAENPFADYSMVYVPYCTGDVHIGNTTKDYGNGVVIQHKGMVNGTTALNDLEKRFPDAKSIMVAGSSAGAFPTPVYGGMIADKLPQANVKVFADSGGAIPDLMSLVITNWGTLDALPAWPEFDGVKAQDFTPPFSFIATARHNSSIEFARHDYAFDAVLSDYARMAGLKPDDLVSVMKSGEAKIEETGRPVATWIGPGDSHTILASNTTYTEEMNGMKFIDWLRSFVAGESATDQYCTLCAN